jgi:hypothetical protein
MTSPPPAGPLPIGAIPSMQTAWAASDMETTAIAMNAARLPPPRPIGATTAQCQGWRSNQIDVYVEVEDEKWQRKEMNNSRMWIHVGQLEWASLQWEGRHNYLCASEVEGNGGCVYLVAVF